MSNKANNKTKDSLVVTAFQTACLAIIVLIAKFIGDLLYRVDLLEPTSIQPLFWLLISISVLDFIELTNIWTSIKKYFKQYNGWLFMIDVVTLGCFFWQVYCLSKLLDDYPDFKELTGNELEQRVKGIIIIFYICIFSLYSLWNLFLKYNDKLKKDDRKNIKTFLIVRLGQMIISIIALLFMEKLLIWVLIIGVLLCIVCVAINNKQLDIFKTLINSQ